MSLVFKPKIRDTYSVPARTVIEKRPLSTSNPITEVDLARIVKLRALNVSYNDIAKLIRRSANTCAFHVHDKMLFVEINERKKKQIEEAMSDEQSNQLV
jgi:hypothetical protein